MINCHVIIKTQSGQELHYMTRQSCTIDAAMHGIELAHQLAAGDGVKVSVRAVKPPRYPTELAVVNDLVGDEVDNARLIAAAPDLLEATQALLDALPSATTHPAIKQARAASQRH